MNAYSIAAALLLALSPEPAAAAPLLEGVDVYGTTRLSEGDIQEKFGPQIKRYLSLLRGKSKGVLKTAESVRVKLESDVKAMGDFAYVKVQKVSSGPDAGSIVVFDVVEMKDAALRLPFRPAPTLRVPEPGGLLEDWKKYYDLGWELTRKGSIGADRVECPAFYCTWGDATEDLKRLQDRFIAEVPSSKDVLLRALSEDADPQRRADALVLLAYLKSGADVARAAETALSDPDDRVREAAMRVISDISVYRQDVPLSIEKAADVMDYPSVDDRTRALAVMLGVANHPRYRRFLLQSASTQVLKLLRMMNASNHDMAYTVLKMLSGESYGSREYEAWENWLQKARKADAEQPEQKK
ncbi:MAG: HEAT repeat domain-containing protein [Elusimicrobia bacterium]|nr:HEAT repeat domain-containing protein [Elusimicrobiota bacterium]